MAGSDPSAGVQKVRDAAQTGGRGAAAEEGAGEFGRQGAEKGLMALTGGASAAIPGVNQAAGKLGEIAGKVTFRGAVAIGSAFVLLVVLLFVSGGGTALISGWSGAVAAPPPPSADQCDAMPENWCDVAYDAQQLTAGGQVPVPWTLIAGLASAQTDFGRTSPYDTVDRYPTRPVPPYLVEHPATSAAVSANIPAGNLGSVNGLNAEQMRNAATIISVGQQLGIPEKGLVIALATALQESSLVNLHSGDRDSQGLFQQRPSSGWGTIAQITDPVLAAKAFYGKADHTNNPGLVDIRGWESMPVTVAAQAVQRSAYPSAYADDEPTAKALVAKLAGKTGASYSGSPTAGGTFGDFELAAFSTTDYVEEGGDGCDVAPPSKAIGGKDGQGSGPFLLSPEAADDLGDDEAQNPCDAADYVAEQLAEAAQEVQADGDYTLGSGSSIQESKEFWQQVIIRADVMVDPQAVTGQCSTSDDTAPVDQMIDEIWGCELGRASDLYVVSDAPVTGSGDVDFDTYDRATGADILISEAKAVSWNFSRWKTDGCSPKQRLAGIFPLTQQQAAAAGASNRCDVQANIRAAAQIVAAGESIDVDDRRAPAGEPFAPMLGGWDRIRPALGNERASFALVGPARSWQPNGACSDQIEQFLRRAAQPGSPFAALVESGRLPKDDSAYRRALRAAGSNPAASVACASPTVAIADDVTGQIADQLATTVEQSGINEHAHSEGGEDTGHTGEGEHPDEAPDGAEADAGYNGEAMRGLQIWFSLQAAAVPPKPAIFGLHSMVDRLSPTGHLVETGPLSGEIEVEPQAWQATATDWAVFYGGLAQPWETFGKRTGSLLRNAGQTAGTASAWGTASQQAQIIIDAAKSQLGVPYSWDGGGPDGPSYGTKQGANIKGFDCSGLTEYAFSKAGYRIGTSTGEQLKAGRAVSGGLSAAQPADLLFFPGHVAIYLGNGMMIHAPHTGAVVRIEKVYATPTAIRRVVQDSALAAGVSFSGNVAFPLPATSNFYDNHNWGSRGSRWDSIHTGNDYSVACGTPVLAATNGQVQIRTDQSWSGRWLVMVSTGTGKLTTWYAHMQNLTVNDGQVVTAGQQIGNVGSEGNSSGCHLHFEYHPRGGSIYEDTTDPNPWLQAAGAYPRRG